MTDNYKKHTTKNPLQRLLIERFFKVLIAEVYKAQPSAVLDVGCGEGFTLEKIRNAGIEGKLEGLDYSDEAITLGRKIHPDLTFKKGTIYELPYKDDSFDLVICSEVLEHLESPKKALAELVRVTSKYCLLTVPNEPFFMLGNFFRGKNVLRFGNDNEHIQHWSSNNFVQFIGKSMDVISVKRPLPWTLVVAKKRG